MMSEMASCAADHCKNQWSYTVNCHFVVDACNAMNTLQGPSIKKAASYLPGDPQARSLFFLFFTLPFNWHSKYIEAWWMDTSCVLCKHYAALHHAFLQLSKSTTSQNDIVFAEVSYGSWWWSFDVYQRKAGLLGIYIFCSHVLNVSATTSF